VVLTHRCVSTTPFGCDVVPDVYTIFAASSGSTSTADKSQAAAAQRHTQRAVTRAVPATSAHNAAVRTVRDIRGSEAGDGSSERHRRRRRRRCGVPDLHKRHRQRQLGGRDNDRTPWRLPWCSCVCPHSSLVRRAGRRARAVLTTTVRSARWMSARCGNSRSNRSWSRMAALQSLSVTPYTSSCATGSDSVSCAASCNTTVHTTRRDATRPLQSTTH
jgi:hypothetical protein